VPITVLEPILKDGIDRSLLLHCKGTFKKDEIENNVPSSNYDRFKSTADYIIRTNEVVAGIDSPYELRLLSDGMTRLSKQIKTRDSDILLKKDYSQWQIERCLEQELLPLVEMSSHCIIGESKVTLVPSIIEALSSDIIISSSPGFLKNINKYLGFNIQYIDV